MKTFEDKCALSEKIVSRAYILKHSTLITKTNQASLALRETNFPVITGECF